jgi:5-methyltetrahydrofolate--homocysteine methyltransferase
VEEGTSWSVPIIEDWTADGRNIDRPHGVWWECALELYRKAAGYSEGKFLVGVPDIHSNMDALSALRGPERLCVDLLDQPERIDRAMALVRRAFAPVFEAVESAGGMAGRGYTGWLPFYSETRFAVLQCDFACMVSPEHFRRWILPALDEESSYLDHSVYHYDGPDALVHLHDVLSIPGIHAIQWVPGAGNPPPIQWMDLLLEIQKAGKGLYLAASPEEVKQFHQTLRPEGVLYDVFVSSEAEARELLDWLKANT